VDKRGVKNAVFRRCVLGSLVVAAVACSEDEAQFKVRFAPEFPKTPPTVSILGVFRDGRMNAETWDEIGPRLSSPFGAATCPVAYDKDFASKREELANAVDDYARANGVTDDLLEKLAPAASGDEVLVFTVAGRPTSQSSDGGGGGGAPPAQTPNTQPGGMRAGRQGRGTMAMGPMRQATRNVFEVAASLYSTHDHRAVGLITMEYTGASAVDALNKFVAKVHESLPGSACAGWHWDANVDAKAIEAMKEE
jgi:hypothetical protein